MFDSFERGSGENNAITEITASKLLSEGEQANR
jgi:hypothetical protein